MQETILDAAIRVAGRDGLLGLTLESVAKEAGLSKSGLLHHFRSKDELLRGMLEHFGREGERLLAAHMENDPEPRLRWARAMLACLVPTDDQRRISPSGLTSDVMGRFLLAAIAAAVNNPELIGPLRDLGVEMRNRLLSDSEHGMEQLLIWLAVDGLFLWQFLGLVDRNDTLYQQIGDALRRKVEISETASSLLEEAAP